MPSLQVQQEKYDAICNGAISSTEDDDLMPFYSSSRFKLVKVASTKTDMEQLVMSLRERLDGNRIGLDAEWNCNFNSIGMQTGRSKLHTIQIPACSFTPNGPIQANTSSQTKVLIQFRYKR